MNINEYNWEGINYPKEKDDWKKFKSGNVKDCSLCLVY